MTYQSKTFSILGDSVSTYEDTVPDGYDVFYTHVKCEMADLPDRRDTWWGQVLTHFGGRLLVNDSWSGSLVTDKYDMPWRSCGYTAFRTGNLGAEGQAPDVILVFIGTNDCGWRVVPTSTDKQDMTVFDNAYGVMLDSIKTNYPMADIWCITPYVPICTAAKNPTCRRPDSLAEEQVYVDIIKRLATDKGCHVIDLHDGEPLIDTMEGLHPNRDGMTAIASRVIAAMEAAAGQGM